MVFGDGCGVVGVGVIVGTGGVDIVAVVVVVVVTVDVDGVVYAVVAVVVVAVVAGVLAVFVAVVFIVVTAVAAVVRRRCHGRCCCICPAGPCPSNVGKQYLPYRHPLYSHPTHCSRPTHATSLECAVLVLQKPVLFRFFSSSMYFFIVAGYSFVVTFSLVEPFLSHAPGVRFALG